MRFDGKFSGTPKDLVEQLFANGLQTGLDDCVNLIGQWQRSGRIKNPGVAVLVLELVVRVICDRMGVNVAEVRRAGELLKPMVIEIVKEEEEKWESN